jgi:hypothetical protein
MYKYLKGIYKENSKKNKRYGQPIKWVGLVIYQ